MWLHPIEAPRRDESQSHLAFARRASLYIRVRYLALKAQFVKLESEEETFE